MKKTCKIVIIGAGSVSFGLSVLKDIFLAEELFGSTLSLVDIDQGNLDKMYGLTCKINEHSGANMKIEKHLNRRDALPGADFVINSIAIERNALWKHDFEVPRKYGIRHPLGENGGPGALFFTMRTIPMIMDIIHDMEELCPKAYFLNFSNPESRIILTLGRYSKIRSVGLCHGVFMGKGDVCNIMGREYGTVDVFAAGLNHFQWLLDIRDNFTNEDLYPLLREKEKDFDPKFEPFCRKLFKHFGYYPSCSDDHVGEYLAYGYEGGEHGYNFEADEYWRGEHNKLIANLTSGAADMKEFLTPSGERAVHVITGILYNKHTAIESGVVYNRGAISNLPYDVAVEVPIMVDGGGIHPISVGPLPAPIDKLCMMQAHVQQLAVEAAVKADKQLALQALLIDPVVNSTTAAVNLLDELWEINKPYIRKCI